MIDTTYALVVAIDFGTARTGYGFAWTSDPNSIIPNKVWPHCPCSYVKTLTELLLDEDGSFQAFGYEARNQFAAAEGTSHIYSRYKLGLHTSEGRSRERKLKAINSNKRTSMLDLISTTLSFVKDRVLNEINLATTTPLSPNRIRWVLTVPAIWDDAAKQIMIDAAIQAGLGTQGSENVTIALEPEAASLYCNNQLAFNMPTETKYIVIDAGGGTVDITCHELLAEGVSEILPPSGGDWGSSYVNENFIHFLEDVFGVDLVSECKKEPEWLKFLDDFEDIKLNATPDENTTKIINISLFISSIGKKAEDLINQWNAKTGEKLGLSKGYLRIPASIIRSFFTPLTNKVVDHVVGLLNNQNLSEAKYIFLVGGFAESLFLQRSINKAFQEERGIRVVIPLRPSLAVISGAVQYGFQPNSIVSRVAARTFGIHTSCEWDETEHKGKSKIIVNGKEYCRDIFDTFVKRGTRIDQNQAISRTYIPLRAEQEAVRFKIYTCNKPNAFFTTDPGVQCIGNLRLSIPEKYKPCREREIEATMKFGGTHLTVEAVYVSTGQKVDAQFKFLLN